MATRVVVLKASKFENPATTTIVSRADIGGMEFRVVEYGDNKYTHTHEDKYDRLLPEKIPKAISTVMNEDGSPVYCATFAATPGVFISDIADDSSVTVNFNNRTITIEHDRLYPNHHVSIYFHYSKDNVA